MTTIDRPAVFEDVDASGSPAEGRPRLAELWLLAAGCGLIAGLLEVGAVVLRKRIFDPDHLYKISRHFVWLVPVADLALFLALGVLASGLVLIWPRRGRRVFTRAACALAMLPALLVAFPRIYSLAWLAVALGLATRIVPFLERRGRLVRRVAWVGLPTTAVIVAILGVSVWIGDRGKQVREAARPMPPAGSPNVLLVVLDTVAAGHLGLHGYARPTSPTLVELADRGIRFDSARASCSWTLPSHATMFTGRWLHELSVGWLTPMDGQHTTLAEFLGDRGYATAGFVANTFYCASSSGLARGFTHYRDFIFPELTALKTTAMVNRALEGYQAIVALTEDWLESAGAFPAIERVWQALDTDRKGAAEVNREFLDWLSRRPQPDRPFFAFLNYFDAHYPYQLPPRRMHRFGVEPTESYQRILIQRWWELDKTTVSPDGVAFAVDSYDDCIADLDEQFGKLVDELGRRGVLEHTWLIVVADHGESFGEHTGIFCHGKSLYETELHVPLIVVPPGGAASRVVTDPVSLRDLAATIVDVAGVKDGAPFPGASLARFWRQDGGEPASASPGLAEVVPNDPGHRDAWGAPAPLPPLGALKRGDWSYIRREADSVEELFDLRSDPGERRNRADDPAARAALQEMRETLRRLTGGPLSPGRFRP
jgi:arylsulfatase A-like enzyme